MTAPSLLFLGRGVEGVTLSGVTRWLNQAEDAHGRELRLDERIAPPSLQASRLAARAWAEQTVGAYCDQRLDEAGRVDLRDQLLTAMMRGLGWRGDDSEIRCDSWFGPGALTVDGGITRPEYPARRLSETIPTRTVESTAKYVASGAIGHAGSIAVHQPGMTNVPRVDVDYNEREITIHTFVTATEIDWYDLMQSSRANFSVVTEKAEAVRQAFAKFKEDALVNGVQGIQFKGLAQIPAPRYVSTVNYTSAALDAMYRDLVAIIQTPEIESGDRGDPPDTLMLGSRWYRAIQRAANYSSGGSLTGADLLSLLQSRGPELSGIQRIVKVPSLSRFGGSATLDGALVLNASDEMSLRQVEAMAPAPVRTVQTLTSDVQLWAMRHGGLDVGSTLPLTIATAQVA